MEETTHIRVSLGAYDTLARRFDGRDARIAIMGLGYVGLPLAAALHGAGFSVVGFDRDELKVSSLRVGQSYLDHLDQEMFAAMLSSDSFHATSDEDDLRGLDAVIVCVPTPLGPHQEPDLGYVLDAGRVIGRTISTDTLVVLESTTYPTTTREVFLPEIESACEADLVSGRDYFVAYSPEREDPGSKTESVSVPKLVGGVDEQSSRLAVLMYSTAFKSVVEVESAEIAEAAKLLENIYRAVNIALVNEMKTVLTELDIDIWKVVEAASTKPFGFQAFYPGPGLGGHCIPIDPFYLTWKAKEVGRPVEFVELAGMVNTRMPLYVTDRLAEALNEVGKPVRKSKVLVIGVAYKPDIADTRESPSIELIRRLADRGAEIWYHDPHVPVLTVDGVEYHDVGIDVGIVEEADVVLVATAHKAVNWALIAQHCNLVVDTRNAMAPFAKELNNRLVQA